MKGKRMRRTMMILAVGALLLTLTASVALAATRYGTSGNDVLSGTGYTDQMYGYAGDDLMYGLQGNDLMYGGRGVDTLYGRDGADNLYGGSGGDGLYGEAGNDYLNAADGQKDYVDCGSGRDSYTTDSVDVVRNCEVPAI
jgi:Ca2+-binding RTX toxin-like protein